MGRRSTKSSPATGAALPFDTVGVTILPGVSLPEWAEPPAEPLMASGPELIADAGPMTQDMVVESAPEAPTAPERAAASAPPQVPAQGAAPAPQHAPEPAFAMAGAGMVGAGAVGTVEAPTAYGQSPSAYGQAPTGYGPPPTGYGPPAPASTPAAPAYMPEPSRYPAAPTPGLVAPAAAQSSATSAPATHVAPPAPRLPSEAAMPSPSAPIHAMPAGPSDMAAHSGPTAATGYAQTLDVGGHCVADPGLAPPPARPGTPQAPNAQTAQAMDQESVPPSQAFSSQERESLSPQHIALLSWWADMMAAGQFPAPTSAAGPDGTDPAEAAEGRRAFPVKAAAVSLLAVAALGAAAVAGSALNLGI